jgi:hypothetical protein
MKFSAGLLRNRRVRTTSEFLTQLPGYLKLRRVLSGMKYADGHDAIRIGSMLLL